MIPHQLLKNDTKIVFLIIGFHQQLSKVTIESILLLVSRFIKPVESVRNIDTRFDNQMSINAYVRKVCRKAFCGLYTGHTVKKVSS